MRYWPALAVAVVIAAVLIGMEFMFLPFHWSTYLLVGGLTIALFTFLFRRRAISRDPVDRAERHASDAAGMSTWDGSTRERPRPTVESGTAR